MWLAMILPFVLSHIDPNYYCLSFANGLIGGASRQNVSTLITNATRISQDSEQLFFYISCITPFSL